MTRMVAIALVLAACGPGRAAPPPAPPDPLLGLWGADLDFGPALRGALELRPAGGGWEATIGGARATLRADGGELRGRFEPDGDELRVHRVGEDRWAGHWIQPRGTVLSQQHATPIVLERQASGAFRGDVEPLRDEIHQYLVIEARGDRRVAWIRETERNVGRFLGDLTVEPRPDGTAAFLRDDGEPAFTARLADRDRLELTIDDVPGPLVHTRRARDDAPGFYPAPPGPWRYRAPSAGPDGWQVDTLAAVDLDPAAITAAIERVRAAVPTSWSTPAVHSILIARHQRLVLEEYFAGYDANRTHDLRSAGKTITTTLLGAAIDRGLVSLDDRVRDSITLAHLASMSSGLDCDDHDEASPGNEDRMQGQRAQLDWYQYTLALAAIRPPGTKGVYCTGALNLIGASLGHATGRWIPSLFDEWYAAPLGITRYHLNLMPTGEGYLGGGVRLRPRDFAKLPQLVLEGGTWNGRRVVSAAWLAQATAAHASLDAPDDYGYGWWRRTLRVDGRDVDVVFASGNGGQLAIAVPALDLIVAIDGGNYGNYPAWRTFMDELVPALLAAAR